MNVFIRIKFDIFFKNGVILFFIGSGTFLFIILLRQYVLVVNSEHMTLEGPYRKVLSHHALGIND